VLQAAGRLRLIAALSWRDYRVVYPLPVLLASSLPRAVLQVVFVCYVGQFAAGTAGRDFALLGGCLQVVTIATVIKASDVLLEDRQLGTLFRLRLSAVPLPVVAATRWWIFAAEGTVDALVAGTAAGLLFGRTDLVAGLWLATPLVLLMALTSSALGMATAAMAITRRADVFVVNLVSYALLALTGAVAPLDRLPVPLGWLAHVLPITNGLLSIRAAVAGRPWLALAAAEAAVGAGWFVLAWLLLAAQERRALAKDTDDKW
jgi:ABC-type polysaccharide/polyol phosphate export permease